MAPGSAHTEVAGNKPLNDTWEFLKKMSRKSPPPPDPYADIPPWEPLPTCKAPPPPGATEVENPAEVPPKPVGEKIDKNDLVIEMENPAETPVGPDPKSLMDLLIGGLQGKEKAREVVPSPGEKVFLVIFSGAQVHLLNTNPTLASDHVKHLKKLSDAGHLGPYGAFTDNDRGFQMFFAESEADVVQHITGDPLMTNNYYQDYEILEIMAVRV